MKNGSKIYSNDPNNFRLRLKTVIGLNCYKDGLFVIPVHPLFLNQLLLNHALNWSQYRINSVSVTTQPTVSTFDDTSLVIGYTTHCTPISHLQQDYFPNVSALNGANGMAHTPLTYKIPVNDSLFHPIVPVVPSDVPFTFFITSVSGQIDISEKCVPHIMIDITFRTQSPGTEIDNVLSDNAPVITLGVADIMSSQIILTSFGFVQASTCPDIDPGELIMLPAFPAPTTAYLFQITHNNQLTDYVNNVSDRGAIMGALKNIH